jgi:hypothetical protein
MGRIKDLQEKIKKLEKDQEDLKKAFAQHAWEQENPPRFKYGDTIKHRRKEIVLTVKSEGVVKQERRSIFDIALNSSISFIRTYMTDTGIGILEINESEFHKVKNNDSKPSHK